MKRILIIEAGLKPGWTKKTADRMTGILVNSGKFECDKATLRKEQKGKEQRTAHGRHQQETIRA